MSRRRAEKSASRCAKSRRPRRAISRAISRRIRRCAFTIPRGLTPIRRSKSISAPGSIPCARNGSTQRGDTETYAGREVQPRDNGYLTAGHAEFASQRETKGQLQPFPGLKRAPRRAVEGGNVSQMHYARKGIITPEMEYIATRETLGRQTQRGQVCADRFAPSASRHRLRRSASIIARSSRPNSCARKSPPAARSFPPT